MWDTYSDPAREAVLKAKELASRTPHGPVGAPHLFVTVLTESGGQGVIGVLLALAGVKFEEAEIYGQSALETPPEDRWNLSVNESWDRVLALAHQESRKQGQTRVELEHLFLASLGFASVAEILGPLGLEPKNLRRHLSAFNANSTPYRQGNPLNRLTEGAKKCVEAAHDAMRASFCGRISTAHLLLGVLADEENTAVETLLRANVNIDELRAAARAQILSDGEIATPQKKFTGAAKRALERSNREAERCTHSFIGPHHLLYALLPHPTTIPENLAYGNALADPLEKVWSYFPVASIELCYQEMWRIDEHDLPRRSHQRKVRRPDNWVKLDWRWTVAGAAWPFIVAFAPIFFEILLVGFGLGVLIAVLGGIAQDRPTRDAACSLIYGGLLGIPVGWIFFSFLTTLR